MNGYQIIQELLMFKSMPGEKFITKFRGKVSLYYNNILLFKKKWIIPPRIRVTTHRIILDGLSNYIIVPLPPIIYFNIRSRKDIYVNYEDINTYTIDLDEKNINIQTIDYFNIIINTNENNIDIISSTIDDFKKKYKKSRK